MLESWMRFVPGEPPPLVEVTPERSAKLKFSIHQLQDGAHGQISGAIDRETTPPGALFMAARLLI